LIIGISLLFSGIFLKLGIVPFHFWIADIYEGSPFLVTTFFASVPKIPFFFILVKLCYTFSAVLIYLNCLSVVSILGVFSILFGTLASMYEVKIKRLLAFASIAHMGYVILPLGLGSLDGLASALFYLVVYVFLSLYVFSTIIAF
jgi:NADH-quinone oxidoreductase subunit N